MCQRKLCNQAHFLSFLFRWLILSDGGIPFPQLPSLRNQHSKPCEFITSALRPLLKAGLAYRVGVERTGEREIRSATSPPNRLPAILEKNSASESERRDSASEAERSRLVHLALDYTRLSQPGACSQVTATAPLLHFYHSSVCERHNIDYIHCKS